MPWYAQLQIFKNWRYVTLEIRPSSVLPSDVSLLCVVEDNEVVFKRTSRYFSPPCFSQWAQFVVKCVVMLRKPAGDWFVLRVTFADWMIRLSTRSNPANVPGSEVSFGITGIANTTSRLWFLWLLPFFLRLDSLLLSWACRDCWNLSCTIPVMVALLSLVELDQVPYPLVMKLACFNLDFGPAHVLQTCQVFPCLFPCFKNTTLVCPAIMFLVLCL